MTREGRRGLLGAAVALSGQAANLLVLAAAAIVVPRLLGPVEYGLFSAAMAVVAVLFVVSTLGLGLAESRFLSPLAAGDDARAAAELASSFWVIRLVASGGAATACAVWIYGSATDLLPATTLAVGLFALARYAFQATRALLLPLDRIRSYVALEVVQSVAFLGLFVAGYLRGGMTLGFLAVAAANLLLFLVAFGRVRGRTRLSIGSFRGERLRPLLGYNASALAGMLAGTARIFLPVWAVAVWGGASQAAYFGLAAQALAWTGMLFSAVLQALLPILSELEDRGEGGRVHGWLDWLMRLAAATLCASVVVWSLIGRDVLELLLGREFIPAYLPVTVLLAASMVSAVATTANSVHFLRRRAGVGALNLILALALTLAGLVWALSGDPGAAALRTSVVCLASAVVFVAAAVWTVSRAEREAPAVGRVFGLMVPAALAWAAAGWQAPLSTRLGAAGLFLIAYAGVVLAARLIPLSELHYLGQLVRGGARRDR